MRDLIITAYTAIFAIIALEAHEQRPMCVAKGGEYARPIIGKGLCIKKDMLVEDWR